MTEKEMIEMLDEDISRLRLPPISEKVFKALEEKRVKYIEAQNLSIHNTVHKIIPRAYIFVAMLMLVVISVPIIVVMTNKLSTSNRPENIIVSVSSEATISGTEKKNSAAQTEENVLERIELKKLYGEVALSGKSEEELEMLLVTYSKDSSVYEEDRYIYNFDSQGRLFEMRKAAFGDEEGQPVDEQTISSNVNALLGEYYPDWLESECDIRIEKNENARPPWSAYVIRSNDDLTKEHLLITFEMTGSVKAVIRSGGQESIGSISKAEAVQIALEELRSGKYGVPDFNVDDIDIIVEVRKRDNEKYYFIAIKNIIVDEIITTGYYMEINAYTGKIEKIKN